MSNSLYFRGTVNSYISIPNNASLNFEAGDFTIEWFQYQTDTNTIPRIFQRGGGYLGVEGFYGFIVVTISAPEYVYVRDTNFFRVSPLTSNSYRNKWIHFAVCRSGGITSVYINGTLKFEASPDMYNYTNAGDLFIGNDNTLASNKAFGGYMYYFHYIKGVAKYTANFTVSTAMVTAIPETVLLLTAAGASGSLGNTVTNNAETFAIVPELSLPPPPPTPQSVPPRFMHALFTDNSRVYYKTNSLASGGIGGVRNHRRKARRT